VAPHRPFAASSPGAFSATTVAAAAVSLLNTAHRPEKCSAKNPRWIPGVSPSRSAKSPSRPTTRNKARRLRFGRAPVKINPPGLSVTAAPNPYFFGLSATWANHENANHADGKSCLTAAVAPAENSPVAPLPFPHREISPRRPFQALPPSTKRNPRPKQILRTGGPFLQTFLTSVQVRREEPNGP